ncbi:MULTISPECIES: 5'-3' exonuclease H3TH domain-containing protein [unclassified Endozoicomonas]|uniref:5'-3' exonuclease H3TH domain-containing protein n=1 Tax=unclassified Endozoicomonas TaxID=2644528 RepID=UPI0021480D37|nr:MULTISPECIES: 5'-3' exonuclease H3TH domain-containing protein [unclassified Endozoicomonas]
MPPHLLLIDALNLIRRVHAAVRAPDEDSQIDGAISATVASLTRAIKETSPTHCLMVFDGNPPTWRHNLFPDYKKGRKPMPEPLRKRLGDFNRAFLNMGVRTFRKSGLEADDVIASVASKASKANVETTILSTDRIFLQLLNAPQIKLRDHFQKFDYQRDSVQKLYGFGADRLTQFWAIAGVGDVPGVQGVGDKGATSLMLEHQEISNIFLLGEESKGAAGKVVKQKDQALLSLKLATLACDLEVGVRMKDLRYGSVSEE